MRPDAGVATAVTLAPPAALSIQPGLPAALLWTSSMWTAMTLTTSSQAIESGSATAPIRGLHCPAIATATPTTMNSRTSREDVEGPRWFWSSHAKSSVCES